jgi:hypothetical protein
VSEAWGPGRVCLDNLITNRRYMLYLFMMRRCLLLSLVLLSRGSGITEKTIATRANILLWGKLLMETAAASAGRITERAGDDAWGSVMSCFV